MTCYVIIGTGVAAISAAESIRAVDGSGELTVIGDDRFGYYSRPGLAYYLAGEANERLLYPYNAEDFRSLLMRSIPGIVRLVLPEEKNVELATGERLPYDKLLIATGAQAVPLMIPGTDLPGVHKLDHLADAKALLANTKRGRTAVVTGGGITALELAEGLAARGLIVHYVFRSPRYWPSVLDEIESGIIENLLQHEGIRLYPRNEIAEILSENGKLSGVCLADGHFQKTDLLAYAIGIAPRTDLARQAGIMCERGIYVDEYMRTSHTDIFAAGDVAQVYDSASGKFLLDTLWNPAREQGWTAGRNMAGLTTTYTKPPVFNVTRLAGLTVTIIGAVGNPNDPDLLGIARGDSETWRQVADAIVAQSGFDVNRLRLMIGEKHVLGAIVIGDQKLSYILQTIVRKKVDITPIRGQLLAKNANIADILADFWAKTTQSTAEGTTENKRSGNYHA